jgi:GIY-YIG catalytic domain
MSTAKVTRKRRSDRNHVIYVIENTNTGHQYIGLTVLAFKGNIKRTINRRFQKHVQRAMAEDKSWALSRSIRRYGSEVFTITALEVIRGKAAAHKRETQLINTLQPLLNTFGVK